MAHIAWTARLKFDKVQQYVAAHQRVWPDTLQAITDAGIRNYSIFLYGTRVFAYYECDDPDEVTRLETEADAIQRWRVEMQGLFETEVAVQGVEFLPQIFRLD